MSLISSVRTERGRLMVSVASRALALVPTALAVGVSLAGAAQAGTVNPVQSTTYNLTPANNPITFGTGTNINTTSGSAVYGDAATSWNVTNNGKLAGLNGVVLESQSYLANNGTISGGAGVFMSAGGTVTNGGAITSTALGGFGVVITTGVGTVTNNGSITATNPGAFGVVLTGGGSVTNNAGATITSDNDGVVIEGGAGSITNAGSIVDNSTAVTGVAAIVQGGGSITNEAGGLLSGNTGAYGKQAFTLTNAGTIVGRGDPGVTLGGGGTVDNEAGGTITGANTGLYGKGGSADVTNAGSITGGTGQGVALVAGGSVENQTGGAITGHVLGVVITGGAGSVTNAGTITGATFNGVSLLGGGTVDNQTGGKISGGNYGVYIAGGDASLTNAGSITGVSDGVRLNGANSSVDNAGSIVSSGTYGFGVYLKSGGGTVTNETGGYISSARSGVAILGGAGTVTNSGVIQSANRDGVFLGVGGQVTNNAGASISGANYGVISLGDTTLTNAGAITATATGGTGVGVVILGAGTVTNQAGGAISGTNGLYAYGALTLTNAGKITGAAAGGFGVSALNGATITNQAGGTISGGYYGVDVRGGGTVTNAGAIAGVEVGVEFLGTSPGVVDNSGSIKSTGTYSLGVALLGGGSVTNEKGGYIGATGVGVIIAGDGGTLTNSGAIQAGYVGAALIGNGDQVTNNAGATLSGATAGLASFGSASITNGGTISATSAKAGYGVAVVGGAATLANQAGGVISGFSGVYSQGGALSLTNAGSITGSGGVGVAALGGATVTNTGSISGASVGLYVGGGATVTNAGTISGGTAAIVFAGAGANTLTLQTGSQLTGAVVGSTDAKATNALVLQGAGEADNAFLNFNTLTAQGTGTWVLGGTSTFGSAEVSSGMLVVDGALTAGATVVNGGDLQVGDAGHAGATLTSAVTVDTGGVLSGHGTVIGDVTNNGGTVSPGGTIGTLTINGDYTQSSAGTLAIELTSAGSSKLVVTGTANLAGALVFDPITGVFRKGQAFDFLTAGAINGAFASITFDGPSIFAISQQGDSLVATATVGNFAIQGGTLNQRAIVPAINNYPVGLTDIDPLLSAIIGLAPGAAQNQAVNELGSEVSPDLVTASRDIVRSQLGGFTEQLAARGGAGQGGASDPVWVQVIGRFGSVDSDGNAHGFHDSTAGIAGGVQRDFGAATLGGGLSYEQTWLSVNGLPQSGNVAAGTVGLYGEERFGPFFADLGGLVGWDHNIAARSIGVGGTVLRSAGADFDGFSAGVTGLLGDRLAMSGGWVVEPRVGFTWSHVDQNGYSESGAGGADLAVAAETQDAVQSLLGARVSKAFSGGLSGDASLDWAHDFNDLTPRAAESFAGVPGTGFTIAGVNPGRDAALMRAGLDYKTGPTTFFARYDGSFSNRADDHQVSAGLRVAF